MKLTLAILLTIQGPALPMTLSEKLEDYRIKAKITLASHLESHPKCPMKHSLPLLDILVFASTNIDNSSVRAWCFPENKIYSIDDPPRIFINSNANWDNEKEAIGNILHELLHLTLVCGNDRRPKSKSGNSVGVCFPFGTNLYSSDDITRAVKEHIF